MSLAGDSAARMDRMYRLQRFIYDPTRKWYLLGRDRLIAELDVPEGGTVLELACGTGRNLARMAECYPGARLYGLDVSEEMLKSARAMRRRAGLGERVALGLGDATAFDPVAVFGGPARFDRVVLSYALSMIPDWRAAIDQALARVAPGGSLHVVDFGDMAGLPAPAARGLRWWLRRFHVTPRPEAMACLAERARAREAWAETADVGRGYAFLAAVR
jgi:S-adenosylmethionine-diacylgycerolhomoserine-N-methlytransferase